MPPNLLVLPLLAGYLFLHISTRFRFRSQALDGYRLLLESAVAGSLLLFAARLVTLLLRDTIVGQYWHDMAPDVAYLGTFATSVVLGLLLPFVDNRRPRFGIYQKIARRLLLRRRQRRLRRIAIGIRNAYRDNRQQALDREIRISGNALIRLLHEASVSTSLVSISLQNRKWYVGYITEAVGSRPNETHFALLPIMSGFRDPGTLQPRRTIYYREIYERESSTSLDLTAFVVRIAVSDVVDARYFDEDVYRDHFAESTK